MYTGFFFDFDGVLSDSECLTWPVVQRVLAQFGLSRVTHQQDVGGWTWLAIADLVGQTQTVDPVRFADACATVFQDTVLDHPQAIPGALDALSRAADCGSVAIVTGSRGEVVRGWLDYFSVGHTVDTIVAAGMYRRAKPDPECYQLALDRLGIKPDHGVVFEDSNAGIKAASSAHLSVVAIADGQARPEGIRRLIKTETESFVPLLDTRFLSRHPLT
ncbi:MAG: hypothetical protein CMH52_05660 [Myxococcales bacterium]|nr:hypothetical protein [Myxococcales bacterium]